MRAPDSASEEHPFGQRRTLNPRYETGAFMPQDQKPMVEFSPPSAGSAPPPLSGLKTIEQDTGPTLGSASS